MAHLDDDNKHLLWDWTKLIGAWCFLVILVKRGPLPAMMTVCSSSQKLFKIESIVTKIFLAFRVFGPLVTQTLSILPLIDASH